MKVPSDLLYGHEAIFIPIQCGSILAVITVAQSAGESGFEIFL
jgi:hypothetical protein